MVRNTRNKKKRGGRGRERERERGRGRDRERETHMEEQCRSTLTSSKLGFLKANVLKLSNISDSSPNYSNPAMNKLNTTSKKLILHESKKLDPLFSMKNKC